MLALSISPRLHGWGSRTDAGLGTTDVIAHAADEDRPVRSNAAAHGNPAMDMHPERLRFGPYRLLRTLDACPAADRLLALHEKKQTSHVVYRFGVFRDAAERRRFIAAVEPLARLDHSHLLPVEEYSFAADGRGWVVTPYTGSQTGLMSLTRLVADKGGQMSPSETERALTHTLEAAQAAHAVGLAHGPLTTDEVLIDRRGSASVELYGLARRLHPEQGGSDVDSTRALEVRSIVELGYQLLAGMRPSRPHIAPSRLVKRLDRRWDAFFAAGLSGAGFPTATDALASLPGAAGAPTLVEPGAARPRLVPVVRRSPLASPGVPSP